MPFTPMWAFTADDHNSASLGQEFTQFGGGVDSSGHARTGERCLVSGSPGFAKNFDVNSFQIAVGFALGPTGAGRIIEFFTSSDYQGSLTLTPAGGLQWESGAGYAKYDSAPSVVLFNVFSWISMEILFQGAAGGSIRIVVNGAEVLHRSGIETHWLPNNRIVFGMLNTAAYFDDVVYGIGSAPPDIRVITPALSPGTLSEWTPTGAPTNLECIEDSPPDGPATYCASSVTGQKDRFAVGPLGLPGTVLGMLVTIVASTDLGSRSIRAIAASDAAEAISPDLACNVGFGHRETTAAMFLTNPATGLAWTSENFGTTVEIGYEAGS